MNVRIKFPFMVKLVNRNGETSFGKSDEVEIVTGTVAFPVFVVTQVPQAGPQLDLSDEQISRIKDRLNEIVAEETIGATVRELVKVAFVRKEGIPDAEDYR